MTAVQGGRDWSDEAAEKRRPATATAYGLAAVTFAGFVALLLAYGVAGFQLHNNLAFGATLAVLAAVFGIVGRRIGEHELYCGRMTRTAYIIGYSISGLSCVGVVALLLAYGAVGFQFHDNVVVGHTLAAVMVVSGLIAFCLHDSRRTCQRMGLDVATRRSP